MSKVCIINTGGTLAMNRSPSGYRAEAGFLAEQLANLDELNRDEMPDFELIEYDPVIDSSNMSPANWWQIAGDIHANYERFDGFVIIHGTDTMAHTASALPFMLPGLDKTVILTGSQIPLMEIRNDARENLITSIMLAVQYKIPEVCVFFGNRLLRGCRTTKISASSFVAFESPNFPPLGTVGTHINVYTHRFRERDAAPLRLCEIMAQPVATFRLFPGVNAAVLENVLKQPLVALILETYGVGNGPSRDRQLLDVVGRATDAGIAIVSCTQCQQGKVDQSHYDAGNAFFDAGVLSGGDMTVEATLAKLQFLFSTYTDPKLIRQSITCDLVGEITAD